MGPHFLSVLNNHSTSYLMDNWQFVLGTMQIMVFEGTNTMDALLFSLQ